MRSCLLSLASGSWSAIAATGVPHQKGWNDAGHSTNRPFLSAL